jgi:hypothetical protein
MLFPSKTFPFLKLITKRVAWRIDPFGSTTTMTKLYRDSGLVHSVNARIPHELNDQMRNNKQLEIMWNLSDGSRVFNHIMDISYCIMKYVCDHDRLT